VADHNNERAAPFTQLAETRLGDLSPYTLSLPFGVYGQLAESHTSNVALRRFNDRWTEQNMSNHFAISNCDE
jgi:hypothetical protein